MPAAVAQQNAITLKGSTEIVTEFFGIPPRCRRCGAFDEALHTVQVTASTGCFPPGWQTLRIGAQNHPQRIV
jgi:hypothetical protein